MEMSEIPDDSPDAPSTATSSVQPPTTSHIAESKDTASNDINHDNPTSSDDQDTMKTSFANQESSTRGIPSTTAATAAAAAEDETPRRPLSVQDYSALLLQKNQNIFTGPRDHNGLFECLQGLSAALQREAAATAAASSIVAATVTPEISPSIDTSVSDTPVRRDVSSELFSLVLRPHLSDQHPSIREACLRAYRFGMATAEDVQVCLSISLHVFVARALERTESGAKSHASVAFDRKSTRNEESRRKVRHDLLLLLCLPLLLLLLSLSL